MCHEVSGLPITGIYASATMKHSVRFAPLGSVVLPSLHQVSAICALHTSLFALCRRTRMGLPCAICAREPAVGDGYRVDIMSRDYMMSERWGARENRNMQEENVLAFTSPASTPQWRDATASPNTAPLEDKEAHSMECESQSGGPGQSNTSGPLRMQDGRSRPSKRSWHHLDSEVLVDSISERFAEMSPNRHKRACTKDAQVSSLSLQTYHHL